MRSALVVGVAQQIERRLQFGFVPDVERLQQLLEGRPDAFDVAVHPGALRCDALMFDAEPGQGEGEDEDPGGEDPFVVGPDLLRLAVMLDRIQQ